MWRPLRSPVSPAKLVVPALVGAAVALALGVYGNAHDPTGESILGDGLFFSATLNMKAWLATAVVLLACLQVFTATWMYDRLPFASNPLLGPDRPPGLRHARLPRSRCRSSTTASGRSASRTRTTRVLVHSLAGCFFYGAFTAKMLWLKVDGPARARAAASSAARCSPRWS